jgi:hypothetical protein
VASSTSLFPLLVLASGPDLCSMTTSGPIFKVQVPQEGPDSVSRPQMQSQRTLHGISSSMSLTASLQSPVKEDEPRLSWPSQIEATLQGALSHVQGLQHLPCLAPPPLPQAGFRLVFCFLGCSEHPYTQLFAHLPKSPCKKNS